MPGYKGADYGGIKTLEDLRQRCVIDTDTGCWVFGARNNAEPMFWIAAIQKHVTAGQALSLLTTGKLMEKGMVFRRMCDCEKCINPKHRQLMTRKENITLNNKAHTPAMRRKRGIAGSRHFIKLTDEQVRDIVESTDKCREAAERHGVDHGYVAALRRKGGRASTVAPTASVFAWRPA